jgi:hypothetical protein
MGGQAYTAVNKKLMVFAILFGFLLSPTSLLPAAGPDVQEIVRRLVEQNENNWKMRLQYNFTERDVYTKRGIVTSRRTFRVLMIDGSPYNELIAEGGHPLAAPRARVEEEKLKAEIARRNHESPSNRRERISKYQRQRQQEHTLMREMVNAFTFKLMGRQRVNGRDCYVLAASPRSGYKPTSNETKVLTGMRGTMWIDTQEYQWVKVEASVFRPVPLEFSLADVHPGTEFFLEQSPQADGIWFPTHFVTKVRATALVFWSKKYTEDETYFDYRRSA